MPAATASGSESAQVYSEERPQFANGKQTKLFSDMQDYAHKPEVQELLQKMCTDLFCERPEKPLDYMIQWLNAEKDRKELTK